MPLFRDRQLRKRWRYLGVYGPDLMLCAGRAEIGPFLQTFWAVWDPESGELHESTRLRRRGQRPEIGMEGSRVTIDAGEVRARLEVGDGREVEAICPSGRSFAWTRKWADIPVTGEVELPGGGRAVDARGMIDESAGYHGRHTAWLWSAGVGRSAEGQSIGWNLVTGINDPPSHSERAVWVEGEPSEVGPVRFDGLDAIEFGDGTRLDFHPEAERARRDNLLLIRSDYRQPFGRFSGSLAGLELAEGYGVMEQHTAVW
jgi:Protein of unknown function (DUF2804)